MTLHYNITKVKDFERLFIKSVNEKEEEITLLHPVTETLIFITTVIGMSKITKSNAREFFFRIKLLETLNGGFFLIDKDRNGYPFKYEMIIRHIGLETNAQEKTIESILVGIKQNISTKVDKEIREYNIAQSKKN